MSPSIATSEVAAPVERSQVPTRRHSSVTRKFSSSIMRSPKVSTASLPGMNGEEGHDTNKTPLKGSLLQSVYNLLQVIETSESEIMIPTLLQDKCDDMDANQVLLGAKMIKASLMGYRDLIDFYMGRAFSNEPNNNNNEKINSVTDNERFVGTNTSASSVSGRKSSMKVSRKTSSTGASSTSGAMSSLGSISDEETSQQPQSLSSLPSSTSAADDGFNSEGQSEAESVSDDDSEEEGSMLQARKTVAQIENLRDSFVDLTLKLQNIMQVYKSSVETMNA